MVDVAKVNLYGKTLGMFRWNRRYNVAEFEYAEDFTGKGIEPSPIMMPVREGRVYSFGGLNWDTFNGLPGMLADKPVLMDKQQSQLYTILNIKHATECR